MTPILTSKATPQMARKVKPRGQSWLLHMLLVGEYKFQIAYEPCNAVNALDQTLQTPYELQPLGVPHETCPFV